jgi:lincosamide nucleotidyltransferase A/C/D/E
MREQDVVEVLTALADVDVESWIDGGWGVDALVGRQTRPHKDLDLMVLAAHAPKAAAALFALGFGHVSGASPAGLYCDATDRRVDISVIEPDDAGSGLIQRTSSGMARYELDDLEGRGSIGHLPVRCLTASAQSRVHAGYERRPEDDHDLRVLGEDVDIEQLPDKSDL